MRECNYETKILAICDDGSTELIGSFTEHSGSSFSTRTSSVNGNSGEFHEEFETDDATEKGMYISEPTSENLKEYLAKTDENSDGYKKAKLLLLFYGLEKEVIGFHCVQREISQRSNNAVLYFHITKENVDLQELPIVNSKVKIPNGPKISFE